MNKRTTNFIQFQKGSEVELMSALNNRKILHFFEESHVDAINTALACRRPLLIMGEPGVGKTQLARAAAAKLGRVFLRHTVDAKTEPRDLLYYYDAVTRLAEAQIADHMGWEVDEIRTELDPVKFYRPEILWWGLNWVYASKMFNGKGACPTKTAEMDGGKPENGAVVLIDEIDKAEMEVPNGLLEVLGEASFLPAGFDSPVKAEGVFPLVMVTTNRERLLPDAFIRRCIVLEMKLPKLPEEKTEFQKKLVQRGKGRFGLSEDVLSKAAEMLIKDRLSSNKPPLPGQAEYFDLLLAVEELENADHPAEKLLEMVRPYIFQKRESL